MTMSLDFMDWSEVDLDEIFDKYTEHDGFFTTDSSCSESQEERLQDIETLNSLNPEAAPTNSGIVILSSKTQRSPHIYDCPVCQKELRSVKALSMINKCDCITDCCNIVNLLKSVCGNHSLVSHTNYECTFPAIEPRFSDFFYYNRFYFYYAVVSHNLAYSGDQR